jgi:uncharacterized protein YcfJ
MHRSFIMRETAFAVAAALALGAPAAFAVGGNFDDYARVTNVTPEYDRVSTPRKECYSETVPEYRERERHGLVGPIIGGVAGGLIGSQVGRGNGRVAASAAGAVVGALVGDRLADRGRRGDYYEREVQRCRVVDTWEDRITGYRVSYEYQGRNYTTVLPYDPGSRLPVRVSVEPATDGYRY